MSQNIKDRGGLENVQCDIQGIMIYMINEDDMTYCVFHFLNLLHNIGQYNTQKQYKHIELCITIVFLRYCRLSLYIVVKMRKEIKLIMNR